MELLRVWQSHWAENMKKVWKQRGGTYGVVEGRVPSTRVCLLGIFRCVNSLIKNHAHWSLMPAYNAKFRPSGFRDCDLKTQDGLSAAGRRFHRLGAVFL
jgi:hypothetical protein